MQQDLLEDFRLGTTNLLITTKFAEDLEIPACSCVIRRVLPRVVLLTKGLMAMLLVVCQIQHI